MSNITNEDVVKALGNLSVLEMIALTKELENKWGVKAEPAPIEISDLPPKETESVQEEFDLWIRSVPPSAKMSVIKLVKEISMLTLKESKDLVEAVPKPVKTGLTKGDAENFKSMLTQAGAEVEVK